MGDEVRLHRECQIVLANVVIGMIYVRTVVWIFADQKVICDHSNGPDIHLIAVGSLFSSQQNLGSNVGGSSAHRLLSFVWLT